MIVRTLLIAITMTSQLVHAHDTISDFKKACVAAKKNAPLCGCFAANLKDKPADQIAVAIEAIRGKAPGPDANSFIYDNLADFLAGLEPHCRKNPKYTSSGS